MRKHLLVTYCVVALEDGHLLGFSTLAMNPKAKEMSGISSEKFNCEGELLESCEASPKQNLDVVKVLSKSLTANFESLSKIMTSSFKSLSDNMEIMTENFKQVAEWSVQDENQELEESKIEERVELVGEPAKKKQKFANENNLSPTGEQGDNTKNQDETLNQGCH